MPTTNMREWLQERPEIETVFACVCDLNGTMRGKRLPIEKAKTIMDDGLRMPLSILGVSTWQKRGKYIFQPFANHVGGMQTARTETVFTLCDRL